jgi:cytochrome c biogenesis protein CcdA
MTTGLNPVIAYAAGAITILSPCVLPLVPIVLGSAAQRHRWGAPALMAGLVLSFTLTGLAVATVGPLLGVDSNSVSLVGAVLLLLFGIALLVPRFQNMAVRVASPLAAWAGSKQTRLEQFGLAGQAAIGALLGLIWSPCVGPTLGAATVLAAQGRDLFGAASVMAAYGLGIATSLLLVVSATRSVIGRWQGSFASAGRNARRALGAIVVTVSLLILTGADHAIEGMLVAASPHWLTDLTTAI